MGNYGDISKRLDKGAYLENIAFREFLNQTQSIDKIKFWRTQDKKEVDFIAEHTDKCDFAFIMAMADEGETCRDTILEKLRPTVMLQKGICFFI